MNTVKPNSRIENAGPGGFTIIECLIALAISAMLMTAVAVAFNASIVNFGENEDMFKALNNTRQALTRMTAELRTADAVDPNAPPNECTFFTANGQDITYQFRSGENKLYLITNNNGSEYVLCDNVTATTFTRTPTDDGLAIKSVLISMSVQCDDAVRTLSAATVIRRNL